MKKLYVGNLSFKATDEEVAALFSEINLHPDSLSRFETVSPASRAASASRNSTMTLPPNRPCNHSTGKISWAALSW